MLICWLIGHRYDYDIKKPELLALVCTRCGKMCVLYEVKTQAQTEIKIDARRAVSPGEFGR